MRNDSIDNFRLELNKPSLRGSFYVRKGDTRARTIHVTITDNGKVKDLSDAIFAEILIKKDDGTQNDQAMVRDGNELQYTLRTQDINVKGECLCWIMVTFSDGAVLTTPTFSIWVSDVEVDQNLEKSTNEYTALSQIIVDVTATQKDIKDYTAEQKAIIDDSVAQADSSSKRADTSAQDAAAKADEANGYAESAEQSYQNTVDKTVEAGSYAAAAKDDREACAEYLDDVTGIAASKMDKVNPTGTGVMFFDGQIVTDTLTSDVVEVSTIGSQRGSDTIAIGSNVKINGALNLSGYDVNDEIGKKLNKDNPRTSGTWIHQSGDIIVPSGSINSGNTVTAPNINGDSITAKNITATGDVQISGTAYVSSAGGSEIKVGYSARGGTKYTTINKDGIKSHSDTDSIVIAANGIDINSPIETDHYIKANTGRIAFMAPSGVHLGDSVTVGHINTTEIMGQEIMSKKAEDGYKLHRLSDKADKKDIIPPLILTSSSPLSSSSLANILGIDAKGKSEQKYGKELIVRPYADSNKTVGTTTFTVNNDGSITVSTSNGTADTFATFAISYGTIVKGSFLSGCPSGGSETGYEFNVINNNEYVVRDYGSGAIAEQDYTSSTVRITIHTNAKFNSITFRPSMKPTIPTPTSPIPITDASGEVSAIKEFVYSGQLLQGYWDASSGAFVSNANNVCSADFIPCENNVSIAYPKTLLRIAIAWFNGTTFIRRDNFDNTNKAEAEVPSNATHFKFNVNDSAPITPSNALAITIQSASNTITLPYTLKSVGTVADELIVNEDGSGQIVQRVGVITTADFENYVSNVGTNSNRCVLTKSSAFIKSKTSLAISNGFKYLEGNNTAIGNNDTVGLFAIRDDLKGFTFRIDKSVSDITNYFKTNAFIVYYELPTPIITDLTAEEVASIRQLQTYKGTTVIESEMDVVSVSYSGDVKGYVDSKTDYSYTDQIIGKWADGKDLHRMVIQTTTPSANSAVKVADIINATIANVKSINGMIVVNDTNQTPVNYWYDATNYTSIWNAQDGIRMKVGATYANKPCEIIVEYTLNEESGIALLSDEGEVVADE